MAAAETKPKCKLVGNDGNVYSIIARVCLTLERAKLRDKVREFKLKAFKCKSYDEVLELCTVYVEIG